MNINVIIFSKNRAAQLELFIRSMKKFFKDFSSNEIKILYKTSNSFFEEGYEKLKKIHSDDNIIYFKESENFKNSLIQLFDKNQKHTVFFVDDNVFKEPFSFNDDEFKHFDINDDILCLSLRLHPRLTYCYPASIDMKTPNFLNDKNVFLWRGLYGDYGYPLSLDGHIYKTSNIIFYILTLESQMASSPVLIPKMMCYNKSIIINNPINKVQNFNNNIHGSITVEYLNGQFLEGKIIDLTPFEGFENRSCHQEIQINFI